MVTNPRKWLSLGGGVLLLAAVAAALLLFIGSSSASSRPQEGSDGGGQAQANSTEEPAALLAIAIGQLSEGDGEEATLDFRGHSRNGFVGGNFRFYSEEHGYYNGGVRTLTCSGDVIEATGAGGLIQPDGKKIGVRYQATFNSATGETTVIVQGKSYEYTMEGELDGLIWCGNPREGPVTA